MCESPNCLARENRAAAPQTKRMRDSRQLSPAIPLEQWYWTLTRNDSATGFEVIRSKWRPVFRTRLNHEAGSQDGFNTPNPNSWTSQPCWFCSTLPTWKPNHNIDPNCIILFQTRSWPSNCTYHIIWCVTIPNVILHYTGHHSTILNVIETTHILFHHIERKHFSAQHHVLSCFSFTLFHYSWIDRPKSQPGNMH